MTPRAGRAAGGPGDRDCAGGGAGAGTTQRGAFGPGAERSGDSYLPEHGNGGYRIRHYDLELDYKIASNRLVGRAVLTALATQGLSRFTLDLGRFRVQEVLVDGRSARYTHRPHKLQVKPAHPIPMGAQFRIEVRYVGHPAPIRGRWGDIGWDELADGVLVASQPNGAPSWFPCDDQPGQKASYRVAVTCASSYTVLVTGDLVGQRPGASRTTWVYERAEPTPAYLMSVQIGRYERLELATQPVPQRAAVPARLRTPFMVDFARQAQAMAAFERLFGPYPFGEYTVVVTDDELEDPIEAQGMSIFGANHVDGRRTHERLVVHELAHQWFGNSLTVADWRHIWLNEGFATYAEWLWSGLSGGSSAEALARQWYAQMAARPADLRVADPGIGRMFDPLVYKRGALTLHALRREIGDTQFFTMLRGWVAGHRHATVTTAAFRAHAQRYARQPLDALFSAWLDQPALPAFPS
ncbi:M1 family peptidase [Micromonospora sp. KC606]|uniref:M1 family metallopeptidase n=1 Tax=Micromonospora sp. KC606 TaxID=2530379 RepID=UPI00104A6519|nr:M1 family metallopeptidase [Micromonospora sp. KC606]TDC86218.1 M1 family peptidase [Micromonospora sp. KC606]